MDTQDVEIQALISQANSGNPEGVTIPHYEEEGDIVIYNVNQSVSWITPDSYNARMVWYDSIIFGGTVDWAVDLNRTYGNNGTGDLRESDDHWAEYAPCALCLAQPRCIINLDNLVSAEDPPAQCASQMAFETLVKMFDVVYNNSTDVNNGHDEMYG